MESRDSFGFSSSSMSGFPATRIPTAAVRQQVMALVRTLEDYEAGFVQHLTSTSSRKAFVTGEARELGASVRNLLSVATTTATHLGVRVPGAVTNLASSARGRAQIDDSTLRIMKQKLLEMREEVQAANRRAASFKRAHGLARMAVRGVANPSFTVSFFFVLLFAVATHIVLRAQCRYRPRRLLRRDAEPTRLLAAFFDGSLHLRSRSKPRTFETFKLGQLCSSSARSSRS